MSEPKHTPSPWTAEPHLFGPTCHWVKTPDGDIQVSIGPHEANANLIAAAPDLLAACERAVEYLTDDEEMLAAIAKAKGELP